METDYQINNKFIVRIPCSKVNTFREITDNERLELNDLINELDKEKVLESLYLASPQLFANLKKLQKRELKEKERTKVVNSFLKYISRYSSRPTPFGMFSGTFTGQFNENIKENKIRVNLKDDIRYNVKIDIDILTRALDILCHTEVNIENNKYRTNNTLYRINSTYRYLEKKLTFDEKIKYELVEVECDSILDEILTICLSETSLKDLISVVVKQGYNLKEARSYIYELINNKLIISTNDLSIVGGDILSQLSENDFKLLFAEIDGVCKDSIKAFFCNESHSFDLENAQKIDAIFKSIVPNSENYSTFHVDTYFKPSINNLDSSLKKDILLGLKVYYALTKGNYENNNINDFAIQLYERYEQQEVPLLSVLDNDLGIGYPINKVNKLSPLVDDLNFTSNYTTAKTFTLNYIETIILSKINKSCGKDSVIELDENDLDIKNISLNNLPDTFSTIAQISYDNGQVLFRFSGFGGTSAANLISRFCHNNDETIDIVNNIVSLEDELCQSKIIAEINHFVDGKAANVLLRPNFRKHEIPIYSNEFKGKSDKIYLNDIVVSSNGNTLKLRSKKYNKELIPKLSSAHNYSSSDIPAYRFLADLQDHGTMPYLKIDLERLANIFNHIPRVCYSNIIISLAIWIIRYDEIKSLFTCADIYNSIDKFLFKERKVDQFVTLVNGDNKLLLNLQNRNCIDILLQEIKTKKTIFLEEFLFSDNDSICVDESGNSIANEFVFLFNKRKKDY